jgi:hypothetical protein
MMFSVEPRHVSTNRSATTLNEPAGILADFFFGLFTSGKSEMGTLTGREGDLAVWRTDY